jgi:hypothetical protein
MRRAPKRVGVLRQPGKGRTASIGQMAARIYSSKVEFVIPFGWGDPQFLLSHCGRDPPGKKTVHLGPLGCEGKDRS